MVPERNATDGKTIFVGIDFGTANMRAARFDQGSIKPLFLLSHSTSPQYIALNDKSQCLTGLEAKSLSRIQPSSVVYFPKLFVGVGYEQAKFILKKHGLPFQIEPNLGSWRFRIDHNGAWLTPEWALEKLLADTYDQLQSGLQDFHVAGCIVTEKYNHDETLSLNHRQVVVEAAKRAGFGQVFGIHEHVAALFGYAIRSIKEDRELKSIVLIDLGADNKRLWHFVFTDGAKVVQIPLEPSLQGGIGIDTSLLSQSAHNENIVTYQNLRLDLEDAKIKSEQQTSLFVPKYGVFSLEEQCKELSEQICALIRPLTGKTMPKPRILLIGGSSWLTGMEDTIEEQFPGCLDESVLCYRETATVDGAAACAYLVQKLSENLRKRLSAVLNDVIRDNCVRLSCILRNDVSDEMLEREIDGMLNWCVLSGIDMQNGSVLPVSRQHMIVRAGYRT